MCHVKYNNFPSSDANTLRAEILARLPDPLLRRMGVAVSGGSDSTALLQLLSEIAQQSKIDLFAATVDHGLRSESTAEAEAVAALARSWGIPHQTLKWQDWDGSGNLQDQARRARYRLLTHWADDLQLDAIVLGHTADDQAETVLMRLARSAGVSGLSGMAAERKEGSVVLLRPMLSITRARLRAHLMTQNIDWIDDPSNQDQRFDRIKVRDALTRLDQIGITAEGLSRVAENLAQAREALAQYARESARRYVQVVDGDLCIDRDGVSPLSEEIRRRLVVAAVAWIAGREYPPRQTTVDQALGALMTGQTFALGGCLMVPDGNKTWICRELNAVASETACQGAIWERRWIVTGPDTSGAEIRPLGEDGILQLKDWRSAAKPRAVVLSTPAVWVDETVLAAPLAGFANGWRAEVPPNRPDFYAAILSH